MTSSVERPPPPFCFVVISVIPAGKITRRPRSSTRRRRGYGCKSASTAHFTWNTHSPVRTATHSRVCTWVYDVPCSAMRSGLPGAKPKPPWVPKRPFVPATPEKRQGGQREAAKRHKIAGRHRGRSMSCYCFISCSFCCRLQLLCLLEIIISDCVAVAA